MRLISKNKRAYFDYEILDTLDAWIILQWHEVKSVKLGNINLRDALVIINETDCYIVNMDIPRYKHASPASVPWYDPKGQRKLLITKHQRTRLWERTQKTWLRILPLFLFEDKNRRLKLQIWLWKSKKKIQKRAIIQERDTKREMERQIRNIAK